MVNVDGSKRVWNMAEVKDIFEKCGAKKPDKATWGDVLYTFAMYYSDGFPNKYNVANPSAGNRIPVAGFAVRILLRKIRIYEVFKNTVVRVVVLEWNLNTFYTIY